MRKLMLTSLLSVFAVSAANAAVINDNPLYRPDKGHLYSKTELSSSTNSTTNVDLGQEFGYGITDRLSVEVAMSMSENNWFDQSAWDTFGFGLNYRLIDMANWKADVYGSYGVGPVWGYRQSFLDENFTNYDWRIGMRAGYMTEAWTVAGHVEFDYVNSESFNWGDDGLHMLTAGVDGFFALNSNWALLVGAEYTGFTDDKSENEGSWEGKLGANYNMDDNKFVGIYMTKTMDHAGAGAGRWDIADGFGFGAKFGFQF